MTQTPFSTDNRLHDLLPYESYDDDTGLFMNKGSVGFVLKGSPLAGANLADQDRLADFLREEVYLPEGSSMQMLLWASPHIGPSLHWWQSYRKPGIYNDLATKRTAFLTSKAFEADTIRDFEVILSFTWPKSVCANVHELLETRVSLKEALAAIGFFGFDVDGKAFIQMMHNLMVPSHNVFPSTVSYNDLESLSAQMTQWSEGWNISATGVHQDAWTWRGYTPKRWPRLWSLSNMDRFLGEMLGSPQTMPTPFWVHYGFFVVQGQKSEKTMAITRRESLENAMKNRLTKWMPELRDHYDEALESVGELQRGERMVVAQLSVGIFSKHGEEPRQEQNFKSLWTKLGWEFRQARFDHLPLFLSCMPMTWTWEDV